MAAVTPISFPCAKNTQDNIVIQSDNNINSTDQNKSNNNNQYQKTIFKFPKPNKISLNLYQKFLKQ